jgi:cell division protein FtsA
VIVTKRTDEKLVVGLDIGTTKVLAVIGEVAGDGAVRVIGLGQAPSRGLRRGVVVNIDSTVQSIQRAIEEAEVMAGCQVHSVCAGIAGTHISSFNSHGMVAIKEKEVASNDVSRVLEAARAIAVPTEQQILHVLPQEYIIDRQEGIREPLGMSGVRLEAKVHVVLGAVSAQQNIIKCVQRCGREADAVVVDQIATGMATLTDDERDLGVCLVDIGGGTTDISVYTDGAIRHTAVIPIAGDQVTNDIAVALRTTTPNAEEIKIKHGCALTRLAGVEPIEVPGNGDRPARRLSSHLLAEVIEPRIEELYGLVRRELQRSGFEAAIGAGVVIAGGSGAMRGMVELGEEVFNVPVRIGTPRLVTGLNGAAGNPGYSTGVGLLMFGARLRTERGFAHGPAAGVKGVMGRVRTLIQGYF